MKNVSVCIDLVFCLIVLPIMVVIFPVERWFHNFPGYVTTVGAWLYMLYFINRVFTVPSLFRNSRRRWLGVGLIVFSLGVTYLLSQVSLYNPKPNIHDDGITRIFPSIQQYQQAVWSLFMIVEAFSFAIGLLTQANIQKSRRRAVEAERDKAEIELYKAQIKPHFMFNTLNSLYGLFLTHDVKALESLEKYISMLRYIHTTSQRDFVPLSEEADYIRQYVELQSLRLNGMTTVVMNIAIEHENLQVPPMLLVTFVENCFKHGVSPVEKSDINITLMEKSGQLIFSTVNRIFPVKRIGEHMGIENCRKRLELLYPRNHSMDIENDSVYYKVKLSIEL
ncbi:sensor histidine kinase [uncultured Duncaniella sp.]|uniref:sensor histidine kinase n=1 Tax=uncultured Duncaniella sp. TaxID=2768039 RepID=UPI0026489253|nr:histidine kinase [uncultured Duncaniella sp.]